MKKRKYKPVIKPRWWIVYESELKCLYIRPRDMYLDDLDEDAVTTCMFNSYKEAQEYIKHYAEINIEAAEHLLSDLKKNLDESLLDEEKFLEKIEYKKKKLKNRRNLYD